MIGNPHGAVPHGATTLAGSGSVPVTPPTPPLDSESPLFFAVEVTAYQPADIVVDYAYGIGSAPHGALSLRASAQASTNTIRASDLGYVSQPADAIGVQPYRPSLKTAFAVNRRLALNPSSDKVSATWGTLELLNPDGYYNALASSQNCDGRPFQVLVGTKRFDRARGLYVDPPYSELRKLVGGVATPWFCDDTSLQIPLRDPSYWLSQPLQSTLYAGTGGLEGGDGITESLLTQPNLLGMPKPMARGGTPDAPIQNITPVLVDAVNLIYQYNDGPGTVVGLTVNGLQNAIAFQEDVDDLYSGTTTSGYYRTCNAKGLFQIGASTGTLTADVTGSFPNGDSSTSAAAIALQVLLQDAAMPPSYIDTESFATVGYVHNYECGYYTSTSTTTAADVVSALLASIGGCMMPRREGTLGVIALRALAAGAAAEAAYGPSTIVSLVPQSLGSPLDPPPYRWRIGVQKNWTVQTSGLNTSLSVLRKSYLGQEYVTAGWGYAGAGWSNPEIQLAYTRPSDPDILPSYLTKAVDGRSLATELGALWSVPGGRQLYAMTVPLALGIRHEIGAVLRVTWPARNLINGALCQIVGEQISASDASTTTFLVLV